MLRRVKIIIPLFLFLVDFHTTAQMRPGWVFRDELIGGLEHPQDTIYIQNRKKLKKLTGLFTCNDSSKLCCRTKSGERIYIQIASSPFIASKHKINIKNEEEIIDNRTCYGIGTNTDTPKQEIQNVCIKWNKQWLSIPKEAYSNLYEPSLQFEGYLSKNKKLLYIYIQGSDGAGSYAVKFVFNKKGYVTRLITTNECADDFDVLDGIAANCE